MLRADLYYLPGQYWLQLARQTCLAETTTPACLPGSSLRVGSDFCTLALTALCTLRLWVHVYTIQTKIVDILLVLIGTRWVSRLYLTAIDDVWGNQLRKEVECGVKQAVFSQHVQCVSYNGVQPDTTHLKSQSDNRERKLNNQAPRQLMKCEGVASLHLEWNSKLSVQYCGTVVMCILILNSEHNNYQYCSTVLLLVSLQIEKISCLIYFVVNIQMSVSLQNWTLCHPCSGAVLWRLRVKNVPSQGNNER